MTRRYLYLAAGAIVFLILHLHFILAWDSLYADYPFAGTRAEPPFFATSERSSLITTIVLFATALGLTLIPKGNQPGLGVALWAGVVTAVVFVWLVTARLRQDSNMWPIDLVFVSAMTGLPMLWGRTAGLLYWCIRNAKRPNLFLVLLALVSFVLTASLWF